MCGFAVNARNKFTEIGIIDKTNWKSAGNWMKKNVWYIRVYGVL